MADNLNFTSQGFGFLPEMDFVRLQGPDAIAFAQAQFANDVQALAVGQWQWNIWLTAKGRVLALFALLRSSEQTLLMLLPDGNADEIATQLAGFVFRRNLRITRPALRAWGGWCVSAVAKGAYAAFDGDTIELDLSGAALPRCLRLLPIVLEQPAIADPAHALAWRQADLRLGLARLAASQRAQWTPQHLALDRLRAFSVRKGCYPGQEIVARTHFLGKAKRSLHLLELDSPVLPGTEIVFQSKQIGHVVSSAATLVLAVLPQDLTPALDSALSVGGQLARPLVLLPGLER